MPGANGSQADGRVVRINGLLKDRLAKTLRLEGITDLGLADERLARSFLPVLNRRFHRGGDPIPTGDNRAGDDARSRRVASSRRACIRLLTVVWLPPRGASVTRYAQDTDST